MPHEQDEGEAKAPPPFVILSLPRSRSAWLSHFLRYGGRTVGHDILIDCRSVADFPRAFEMGLDGTCETAAMLGWQLIRHLMPKARLITIHRPVAEVEKSLAAAGFPVDSEELEIREALLESASRAPGVRRFEYSALADPMVCKELFELALGPRLEFDLAWWNYCAGVNIQVNAAERLAKLAKAGHRMAVLKSEARCALERLDGRQGWLFN